MSITIIKPGFSCSIQDLGRWGFQKYGIPVGGAMDALAASVANRICGNDDGDAVLECTLHGTEILLNETAIFAISGGGSSMTVNGQSVPFNKQIKAVAGSTIKLHPDPRGCRSYIAFDGGLNAALELGSRSTYTTSSLGGYEGRNLVAGDQIQFKKNSANNKKDDIIINENGFGSSNWKSVSKLLPHVNDEVHINCFKGPEWDLFTESSHLDIINNLCTISSNSNRMGYQIEGLHLELREKKEMVSTAVAKGIIQVTNQGSPIVLMADAQTIGGYPRIARVTNEDIHLLAQCRPGMKIKLNIMPLSI